MSIMHNTKNKKILIVGLFPPPYSSGERVITQYVNDLLEPIYDVTAINMSIGILAPPSFKLSSISYYLKTLINFILVFKKVYFLTRSNQFSLCYLTPSSSSLGHIRDTIIVKLLNNNIKSLVINIQNGNYDIVFKRGWHSQLTKAYASRITTAIFTSEILKKRCIDNLGEDKCAIIRNSVDDKVTCTHEEVTTAMSIKNKSDSFIICYISNMSPTKGYMDLFEALKSMDAKERHSITVHFVGEWLSNEQLIDFKNLLSQNDLEKHVVIHGKINDRVLLKKFYLQSHVFILPTYFPQEAQPVSIIEALNAGVPVISTKHASIPDLIKEGNNGILVDIKSPTQIKKAILKLKSDKLYWNKLSLNARRFFLENFTSEKIRKSLLDLFNKELNRN